MSTLTASAGNVTLSISANNNANGANNAGMRGIFCINCLVIVVVAFVLVFVHIAVMAQFRLVAVMSALFNGQRTAAR
ncbi:MAG: hypothetical protein LBN41_02190 [Enterobacteriaceae bacterium]|nr:hypothetical protein [Enterobacteriaceae bacterium]